MSDALALRPILDEAVLSEESRTLLRDAEGSNPRLLASWLRCLAESRPALLKALQQAGVSLLRERQQLANVIGKQVREGRLTLPVLPRPPRMPSPPPVRELERAAAARLRSSENAPAAPVAIGDGDDDAELLDAIPADHFVPTLEAAGVERFHAQLLLNARGMRGLRIGFWSNQLCERGTETALYDYAHYAETILGCVAFILYDATSRKHAIVYDDGE